jgi:uncharacterized membrane protein (UPF0136 family)
MVRAIVMMLSMLAFILGIIGFFEYQDSSWLVVAVIGLGVLLLADWALPGIEE